MFAGVLSLGLFDDVGFWFSVGWWLLLAYVAFWLYKWCEEHLAFSPILTVTVAAILIYYMVIEHPEWGIFAMLVSLMMFSGLIWILPILFLPFGGLFKKH